MLSSARRQGMADGWNGQVTAPCARQAELVEAIRQYVTWVNDARNPEKTDAKGAESINVIGHARINM